MVRVENVDGYHRTGEDVPTVAAIESRNGADHVRECRHDDREARLRHEPGVAVALLVQHHVAA
jgi:hypothetical protein